MELLEFQASQVFRARLDTTADGIVVPDPYLKGLTVKLCKVDVDINPETPPSAFTTNESSFPGYTAKLITWLAPTVGDDGKVEVVGTVPSWVPSADSDEVVYCMFMQDPDSGDNWFAGRFDEAPIPVGSALETLMIVMRYRPAAATRVTVVH